MSIILLIILLWGFLAFPWVFNNFKPTDIFFQNIRRYISDIFDISVKSKYRYICDYRYFHPWLIHDTFIWPTSLIFIKLHIHWSLTFCPLVALFFLPPKCFFFANLDFLACPKIFLSLIICFRLLKFIKEFLFCWKILLQTY